MYSGCRTAGPPLRVGLSRCAVCLLGCVLLGNTALAGHLVIIGGGNRSPEIMARLVALAGGAASRIVVIPSASENPEEVGRSQVEEFRSFGASARVILPIPGDADHDTLLLAVREATGVFFSGGDQRRLAATLEEIRALLSRGGVVGGTSAGAAVMSTLMITGDEAREQPPEDAFSTIEADQVVTAPGFGFITNAIVDQHFVKRRRHNRLLSLVLQNPHLVGIGIDEDTAVMVDSCGQMEVLGESCVVVYDATRAQRILRRENGRLEGVGLVLHVLTEGSVFDLSSREVIR